MMPGVFSFVTKWSFRLWSVGFLFDCLYQFARAYEVAKANADFFDACLDRTFRARFGPQCFDADKKTPTHWFLDSVNLASSEVNVCVFFKCESAWSIKGMLTMIFLGVIKSFLWDFAKRTVKRRRLIAPYEVD
jgi:hypothetical protein